MVSASCAETIYSPNWSRAFRRCAVNIILLTEIHRQGLPQHELARRAKITESSLSRLIHERAMPDKTALRIEKSVAEVLRKDVVDLFPWRRNPGAAR